jgi:hypothetical protein
MHVYFLCLKHDRSQQLHIAASSTRKLTAKLKDLPGQAETLRENVSLVCATVLDVAERRVKRYASIAATMPRMIKLKRFVFSR